MDEAGTTRSTEIQAKDTEKNGALLIAEASVPVGGIAFYVAGTSDPVLFCSDEEFVIGRKIGETSEPFLDLAGRLHPRRPRGETPWPGHLRLLSLPSGSLRPAFGI